MTNIVQLKDLRTLAGDEHRTPEERDLDCGIRFLLGIWSHSGHVHMRTWRTSDYYPGVWVANTPHQARNTPYKNPRWRGKFLRIRMTKRSVLFRRNPFLVARDGSYILKHEEE